MVDTSWSIDDGVNTYTIDGITLSNGWLDFQVGQTIDTTFVFNEGNHTSRYDVFVETFAQPSVEGLVVTGQDFNTFPYYSYTGVPSAPERTLLWKLSPADRINGVESWWVVPTAIEDETRRKGSTEFLAVTMFVIAPVSEGNRTYIENRYEEEL